MQEKKQRLRMSVVKMLPLFCLGLVLSALLPWLSNETAAFTGLQLIANPIIKAAPALIAAFLAFGLSLTLYIKPKKFVIILITALLAAAIALGIYCMLTAKASADKAEAFLQTPFMIRNLGIGFYVFLALTFACVVVSLNAMREPVEYLVLSVMSLVWLLPIVWLVLTALRVEPGAYTPYVFPKGYTLQNFQRLFTETGLFNFPRWYLNTLIVASFTCLFTTMFVLMISYTFSRLRFKSRKKLMNIGLILTMFPGFMSMIAIYHILKAIGLAQSLVALIMVYSAGGAMGYFIAKGFFDTIPRSLDEAATIDGASKHTVFWKIILPSSSPIVVYTAISAFIGPWVDFIFVSVIMKDDYQNYTVALGLFKMLEREHIYEYFTRFCAGAVLVALPITLLFIKIQKFYVEGVTGGAVKG